MGRPPSNGGPSFRFSQPEVAEMEAILQTHKTAMPAREILIALAEKFSKSEERSGKIEVQMKQVWNWFQNRRYAIRAKAAKSPGKLNATHMARDDSARNNLPQATQQLSAPSAAVRPLPQASQHPTGPPAVVRAFPQATQHPAAFSGRVADNSQMEYEAKSARDGAWYDVATFLSHRSLETGDPEVLVRFAGFGAEEDEWVNVKKNVRQRSLPCESSECVAVLPADLILCFQEGKEQALYFDAHVLDAQRRRHDVRGCRCRFLVRYDHDQSEEIVALRKICRRPETDYRLQQLHAVNDPLSANQNKNGANNIHTVSTLRVYPPAETPIKHPKVEHAVLSPAEVPQKRQKVDSKTPALLQEEPQRQCKVEPVLLTASGEVPQNQCKVEPALAPATSPDVAQNQHKLLPVLSMPSAQASLEPHKVEPVVTASSTQPLVERQKVESVEPAQPSLQQQVNPLVSALLAEVPVELHQLQDVVPVLSTEASAEPQEVKTMIPSPSAKVTPELQTVQPIVADQTVEPVMADQTLEPIVADQTVEPVVTDHTVVADASAEVLQEQHKVEPAPSAEPIVEPHGVEFMIPAISTKVSFEPQAAESVVPPSTQVLLEQHKLQSDASSSKLIVEPHKVEPVMPAASAEVPVEPHKEPIMAMGSALTDPPHPDATEVNEIKLEQPAATAPINGAEVTEVEFQHPKISEAESSSILGNSDIQPENVDIELAKVMEIGNIDNMENPIVPSENSSAAGDSCQGMQQV